jgi:hypothetical protein
LTWAGCIERRNAPIHEACTLISDDRYADQRSCCLTDLAAWCHGSQYPRQVIEYC